jgi:putative solute:sodium symporter small subunit
MNKNDTYWKTNLKYLVILLSIWFSVSFGFGILLADTLNQFHLGGFKLGFWFAQQGAIYVIVILIFVYIYLMNRLDQKFKNDK